MKREKLIKRRRSEYDEHTGAWLGRRRSNYDERGVKRRPKTFAFKPRAFIHRSKRLVDQLRDLPVEKLSPIRHFVHHMEIHPYEDETRFRAIAFMTQKGTVILTGDEAMFVSLYRQLRRDFGAAEVPKKEPAVARYQQRRERAA